MARLRTAVFFLNRLRPEESPSAGVFTPVSEAGRISPIRSSFRRGSDGSSRAGQRIRRELPGTVAGEVPDKPPGNPRGYAQVFRKSSKSQSNWGLLQQDPSVRIPYSLINNRKHFARASNLAPNFPIFVSAECSAWKDCFTFTALR